ncbi:MAG: SCO family protein [Psychroserpens sp.]|nr:SCO family protein [Psychroserpens sp.]
MYRIVPVLFLLLWSCESPKQDLPILSYKIDESGNTAYYQITYEPGKFTDQSGNQFSTTDLQHKVILANFFFTKCPSICPPMRNVLIDLSEEFYEEPGLMILSHTIDPNHDTTEVLQAYSEATEIPTEKWKFLRAQTEDTKLLAKQYMTNFKPNVEGTDFYHSSYAALVDSSRQIRGIYNLLEDSELNRLKKDIEFLID